ncbi:transcription factor [Ganoderma sinense ZZ0214-1]|uniref:Transcription factor n=1 Tax=Ganoderma sinense ZZ0214-1 TaxID=1077348 RepID=A0A2G8SAZ3_9APHY|nr:transcription factor [Ganoderma sinense ZZ0214-1]
MQHPFGGGREGGGMFPVPAGYDEDAIGRALRAMQQDAPAPPQAHSNPPPVMGPPPVPLMPPGASGGPQVTEMFLAALPWLQYLQIQQQQAGAGQIPHPSQGPMPSMHGHGHGRGHGQQQHTPQHPFYPQQQQELVAHQQQQQRTLSPSQFGVMPPRRPSSQPQQQGGFPFMPPPHQQSPSFSAGHFGTLLPLEASSSQMEGIMPLPGPMQRSSSAGNTPSPEATHGIDPAEMDATTIAEDKRRRNTAASARFRIKKKQWTLNLERTIGDLSGRVEELEREASELRRENGWLKEIVMLKSKRLAGIVPELEPSPSGSGSGGAGASGSGSGSGGPRHEQTPEEEESEEEAEEADQQRTRSGRNEKGKGRQQR